MLIEVAHFGLKRFLNDLTHFPIFNFKTFSSLSPSFLSPCRERGAKRVSTQNRLNFIILPRVEHLVKQNYCVRFFFSSSHYRGVPRSCGLDICTRIISLFIFPKLLLFFFPQKAKKKWALLPYLVGSKRFPCLHEVRSISSSTCFPCSPPVASSLPTRRTTAFNTLVTR